MDQTGLKMGRHSNFINQNFSQTIRCVVLVKSGHTSVTG